MEEWNENEEFEIVFSRKQVHEIITEYYKKYHNFNGEIKFKLYYESKPDGWGFYDDFGRMDFTNYNAMDGSPKDINAFSVTIY